MILVPGQGLGATGSKELAFGLGGFGGLTPPLASFTIDEDTITNDGLASIFTFTSTSSDPDGTIDNNAWTVEMLSGSVWVSIYLTSGPSVTEIEFTAPITGTYRTTLVVTDNDFLQDEEVYQFDTIVSRLFGGLIVGRAKMNVT